MPKPTRGFLISFEGTEGSGKSTLIQQVAILLGKKGHSVVLTREPGGDPVAEKIREILLKMPMDPKTELLLYEAARAEHLANTIRPALGRGDIILCDRFTDSTLAYQAHARGLPWKEVKTLNRLATSGIRPNLTVWLDIDPEQGLRRASDPNRFEAEGVEFQKRVRAGYLKARADDPRRWMTLKAQSGTPLELGEKVLKQLAKRLKIKFPGKNHG